MSESFEKFNQLNLIVSPEDVFDFIGARLEKDDGTRLTYSCPYHTDDSPSLLVDKQTGKYNCFACECGGIGGYSCAKYYLTQTNSVKPTVLMTVNFMEEVDHRIGQFKYLFTVRQQREYEHGNNKRSNFLNRIKVPEPSTTLAVNRKYMNDEQVKMYIDSIMTNMPEEFMVSTLGIERTEYQEKGSDEFLTLLED